ncbi:MAG TPA: hypothetical protein VFY40_04285 [Blastocatellia bacterium]|nr:hypothetical protein [Blastocatellia bacterium]
MPNTKVSESLTLLGRQNGVVVIPAGTPLTRLNYFDGKFLRASDLKTEQEYLRQLVRQSNQAGGPGVVHGYDVTLGDGDTLDIGPGLAIDAQGRALLLPNGTSIDIQELIDKSQALQNAFSASQVQGDGRFGPCQLISATPAGPPLAASDLFVITISPAEALCGEEDVFGNFCEEACVTSADRPFVVEGLTVRAIPLALQTPLPNSKAFPLTGLHLRSRVASAYFEDERRRVASLISKAGLEQAVWRLGADAESGGGVPIGVIAREGSGTVFLDPWIARRERIDPPAKRYWQWRMMMRPWDVFLAQVLQFQCQLHDLFKNIPTPGGDGDPCGGARGAISEAAATIAELKQFYESVTERFTTLQAPLDEAVTFKGGVSRLTTLNTKLLAVESALAVAPQDRMLIHGGIVELPSAGYLPVTPGAGLTINQQARRLMGEGVDLRFCVISPDFVAHALEEAQHMERISLLQGLDNPQNKARVDILVPNGEILTQQNLSPGRGFEAIVDLNLALFTQPSPPSPQFPDHFPFPSTAASATARIPVSSVRFNGAARTDRLPSGGGAAYIGAEYATNDRRAGLWINLQCERNIFELKRGDTTNFNAGAVVGVTKVRTPPLEVELNGVFKITQEAVRTGGALSLKGLIENARLSFLGAAFGDTVDNSAQGRAILIDLDATVTMTGGSAIKIILTHQQRRIELSADWSKQPLEVNARFKTISQSAEGSAQEVVLAEAALKENPDALSDKNSKHILALDALEVIATTLNDADFADANARLLFPPAPKPTDEMIVRGVMDWVLFHRRRDEKCQEESLKPAPAPPSRVYQVYHLLAESMNEAVAIRKLLLENGALPVDRVSPVGAVEFGGGVATLVTTPESILTDWRKVQPGEIIIYGAIGNRDSASADGEELALARLDRIEATLSSISKTHPRAIDDLLSGAPSSIPATGVDGVILLMTFHQVAQTCHIVYRVGGPQMDIVRSMLSRGDLGSAIGQSGAQLVGEVNFDKDTDDVSDDSLQSAAGKWLLMGGGAPDQVVVSTSADDQTFPGAIATAQSRIIQIAFSPPGTTPPPPEYIPSPEAFPSDVECPAVAFVAPQTQITRTSVVIFAQFIDFQRLLDIDSPHETVVFSKNVPQGGGLKNLIATTPSARFPISGITLGVLTPPPDADAALRIEAVVDALVAAGRPTSISRKSSGALSQRDTAMLTKIGVPLEGVDEVIFLER